MLKRRARSRLPYHMFDRERFSLEAKNARVLERIYHKGQRLSWDGNEVLAALIKKHGRPSIDRDKREALGRLFAVIMWGELAAWKVSAALAEELEVFSAKMAATSQAFDEARHFYVMHDYLEVLGARPERLDRSTEMLLDRVMNADHLAKKLLGMQLLVEPVALAIFHIVRKLELEPVLTELMPYYERDEARHVALGIKYLPAMIRQMSLRERADLWRYQVRLVTYELWGSVGLMRDFKALGINPRLAADVGRAKQRRALEMMLEESGVRSNLPLELLDRYGLAVMEAILPVEDEPLRDRIRRVAHAAMHGKAMDPRVGIEPDIAPPAA